MIDVSIDTGRQHTLEKLCRSYINPSFFNQVTWNNLQSETNENEIGSEWEGYKQSKHMPIIFEKGIGMWGGYAPVAEKS